jgi:hypothetical protein
MFFLLVTDSRNELIFKGFKFGVLIIKNTNPMKKFALLFTLFFFMLSTTVDAQSGHYKNGKGSSHKGGKYKNSSTNNHYKKRK